MKLCFDSTCQLIIVQSLTLFISREAMFEFCNNEEVKKLFIFFSTSSGGKNLVASLHPPNSVQEKSVYFVKIHNAGKLSRDNIVTDVAFCDSSYQPLSHASTLTKDVFLPLLSIEMGGGVSADKIDGLGAQACFTYAGR